MKPTAGNCPPITARRRVVGLLLVLGLLGDCGCGPAPSGVSADPPPASPDPTASPPQAAAKTDRQFWDVQHIQGARVGYVRTTISHQTRAGRQIVRIEALEHLSIKRLGVQLEINMQFVSTETPDGELLEFQSEVSLGPTPMRSTARVVADKLVIETTTQGKTTTGSIPWSADYGGFHAMEQALARQPMTPGGRRTIRALVPVVNQVATIELVARDYEPVRLLAGAYNLLRIDTTMALPGSPAISGSVWTDRTGEVLKSHSRQMNIETFRTTKAVALDKTELGQIDLGLDVAIAVDRPLKNPHDTKQVRYRVHLDGNDPAGVFSSGLSQRIKSIDPHTAEVTVYAVRPDEQSGNPDAVDDPPSDDDRKPNNLIQSDDAKIVAVAREAAGRQKDPWLAAVALERHVRNLIKLKDFSQVFASAAEVIESGQGDCTEHAVLLAALARARGIPARVAMGLVYLENKKAFFYHMWTEVCIKGRWIPLDATLGKGGIGAAHLKLAHSNLAGASAYSSFLPIAQVLGRLHVEIIEAR